MKKIMIVEDEAVIALRLEQRLTEMGYEVIGTFHSGEAAVENARDFQPDIVLMDIMMPGDLDGIDAAKILREELDIPVIFLTAYSEDKIIERAKLAEPYGYLVKPIRDRELKATIEIALYKKKVEEELEGVCHTGSSSKMYDIVLKGDVRKRAYIYLRNSGYKVKFEEN